MIGSFPLKSASVPMYNSLSTRGDEKKNVKKKQNNRYRIIKIKDVLGSFILRFSFHNHYHENENENYVSRPEESFATLILMKIQA